jgi:hypothetical protein
MLIEVDLDEALQQITAGTLHLHSNSFGQGARDLRPVNRMDCMGVAHHGFGFVALQLPHKMPPQPQVTQQA